MLKRTLLGSLILILVFSVVACGAGQPAATPTPEPAVEPTATSEPVDEATPTTEPAEPQTVRLMSHDSFNISEDVLAEFEETYNATLEFVKSGDTGAALNQAILSKENPLGDAFFGVDNTFFSRAIDAGIFVPYEPENLDKVPEEFKLDPQNRLTPIDWGDVCLNYDKTYFADADVAPPQSLEDLTEPAYEGLTVVENPATSSPGLAFLLATVEHFGTDGDYTWENYWQDLRANGVQVTDGWEAAYYGSFTAASDGDRPIVVSYATSPPAEVYFAEEDLEEAPTASVTGDTSCFRQIEFAGVLQNAENPELAKRLIDFMLTETFQSDVPLQMFVFPVREDVELPDVFTKYGQVAEQPARLDPETIGQNRDQWIERWTEIVLR